MIHWLRAKKKFLIIGALLAVYLVTAYPLYVWLVLKHGKPVSAAIQPPPETPGTIFKLGDFTPVRIDGQDLYQLRGYAFPQADPGLDNKITVLLDSPARSLAFATQAQPHPNMIESYPGYKPEMREAEFILLIAPEALPPGTYGVGIILEPIQGTGRSYVRTGARVVKTPNTIRYFPPP